jgi:hypothetical protein
MGSGKNRVEIAAFCPVADLAIFLEKTVQSGKGDAAMYLKGGSDRESDGRRKGANAKKAGKMPPVADLAVFLEKTVQSGKGDAAMYPKGGAARESDGCQLDAGGEAFPAEMLSQTSQMRQIFKPLQLRR